MGSLDGLGSFATLLNPHKENKTVKHNQIDCLGEALGHDTEERMSSFLRKEIQLPNVPAQKVHNQAFEARNYWLHEGLRYRSQPEVCIAKALDKAGVLFLPNCMARLSDRHGRRVNREPDFLIFWKNKSGILEVDGEDYHPPSRTVDDHKRDLLFKRCGIQTVEQYDAAACVRYSEDIVEDFISLL
ncbi:MAG: hypothetical protein IGS48_15540 [Oscillatoriales cyanobacterium C42_A2020_001]|nr:hypothetical protein [Leptolyngbyaceae cyanobacterium C42_A2020_001]